MNELSLFTGIGGGLLGTKLLGWRHIGYVEINEYCQRVLQQRIKDGYLDDAPIFGDIREFNRTYAQEFKGMVDIVTAGFPCQPFSVAGKRQGADDERNMWPATIECIRKVRPRYVLLENVPGLLSAPKLWLVALEKIQQVDIFGKGNKNSLLSRINRLIFKAFGVSYLGRIFGDLAESGYDCRWRCLSAAEVGANHKRNRLWIMAYSTGDQYSGNSRAIQESDEQTQKERQERRIPQFGGTGKRQDVPDSDRSRQHSAKKGQAGNNTRRGSSILADSDNTKTSRQREHGRERLPKSESGRFGEGCHNVSDTEEQSIGYRLCQGESSEERRGRSCNSGSSKDAICDSECGRCSRESRRGTGTKFKNGCWWSAEPDLGRLAYGIPNRLDRLKAIGNAQVPAVVRAVWELLNEKV